MAVMRVASVLMRSSTRAAAASTVGKHHLRTLKRYMSCSEFCGRPATSIGVPRSIITLARSFHAVVCPSTSRRAVGLPPSALSNSVSRDESTRSSVIPCESRSQFTRVAMPSLIARAMPSRRVAPSIGAYQRMLSSPTEAISPRVDSLNPLDVLIVREGLHPNPSKASSITARQKFARRLRSITR